MAFIKQTLSPFSTRAADPFFEFEEPYIQYGVISGQSYTASQVSYGLPKASYLQIAESSNTVTVVASTDEPIRMIFALGIHDANTGGEVGAWRSFTGKSVANSTVTVSVTGKAWVYAEVNENGQPSNLNAWTIDYASESSVGRTYTTSRTEPTSPANGDVWFDVINNKLFKYSTDSASWEYKKRVYIGEAGVGDNGYLYSIQSWYPNRGYADYEDSNYIYYENPWRHYDGVSFTTNGQYTAIESANWANNATIGQAVAGNQIAMNAVANSASAMDNITQAANTMNAIANSLVAIQSLEANTSAITFIANSSIAINPIANSSIVMPTIANSSAYMPIYANSSIAMIEIANSSIAMSSIANSSIAMVSIANSAIAQSRIVEGSQISTFRDVFANNPTTLDILKNGSTSNILFDVIGANSSYSILVANAQGQLVTLANSTKGPILAVGGNTVTEITDGGVDYRVHTFTGTGSLNVRSVGEQANVQYVVIAGGGGGGNNRAGGGGAGGYRTNVPGQLSGGSPGTAEPALSVAQSTSYTITVGAGAAGGLASPAPGDIIGGQGSASSFGPLISTIGGGGGTSQQRNSNSPLHNGGSGGGGSSHDTDADDPSIGRGYNGGTGTPGQGFNGGNSVAPNIGGSAGIGGGGGGSGGAGANAINPTAPLGPYTYAPQVSGNGGTGRTSPITGTSIMYAGGGGGGGTGPSGAAGGHPVISGGGYGKVRGDAPNAPESFPAPTFPINGLANRGGGGGGHGSYSAGGAGGSGIVIIRYPIEKV